MALMPLIPETKMADVGKLIRLGNLLVRKVTWLVLATTSAAMILSRVFGADCMTRIAYIYSGLPRTHSFPLWLPETTHILYLTFWFPAVNPTKMYTFYNLFLSCSTFSVRFAPASNTTTEIPSDNQHGRRHMPSRTRCYISIYQYLTWKF